MISTKMRRKAHILLEFIWSLWSLLVDKAQLIHAPFFSLVHILQTWKIWTLIIRMVFLTYKEDFYEIQGIFIPTTCFCALGGKMANPFPASSCFLLIYKVSIYIENICNILAFMSSKIPPIVD